MTIPLCIGNQASNGAYNGGSVTFFLLLADHTRTHTQTQIALLIFSKTGIWPEDLFSLLQNLLQNNTTVQMHILAVHCHLSP